MKSTGISGKIAAAFIQSKLTPLLVIASILLGIFAVMVTPREEEPQIVVPMIDVFVSYPGASPKEVEERVTIPMEKFLSEIKGVEYIYSIVKPGSNITIVRFYVGENMEDSLVKLYNKLMSNYDQIPPGVSRPMVKPKSIDDVPILSLTLWSPNPQYTGYELRRIATALCGELKKNASVSEFSVIGGQRRQVRVTLDAQRLRVYRLSAFQIMDALQKANVVIPSGTFSAGNRETIVETGRFLRDAQDVGRLVVQVSNGRPVYLKDVAQITDGPEEASNYVFMGMGPQAAKKGLTGDFAGQHEAVTIAVSKQKGANASIVTDEAFKKVEALKGHLIPKDVQVTVTRNYGETAKEKSDELLFHMLLATFSVIILIALFLGWRESVVVAVAVPVTLALRELPPHVVGAFAGLGVIVMVLLSRAWLGEKLRRSDAVYAAGMGLAIGLLSLSATVGAGRDGDPLRLAAAAVFPFLLIAGAFFVRVGRRRLAILLAAVSGISAGMIVVLMRMLVQSFGTRVGDYFASPHFYLYLVFSLLAFLSLQFAYKLETLLRTGPVQYGAAILYPFFCSVLVFGNPVRPVQATAILVIITAVVGILRGRDV